MCDVRWAGHPDTRLVAGRDCESLSCVISDVSSVPRPAWRVAGRAAAPAPVAVTVTL